EKIGKGSSVTISVSTGKPRAAVPRMIGQTVVDAVSALAGRHLKAKVFEVDSEKKPGTVTGQEPKAGVSVVEGSAVRINVSRGPKPIDVPSVVGKSFDSASNALQAAGFTAVRQVVEADQPPGTVVREIPASGTPQ